MARAALGLSQARTAVLAGVAWSTLRRVEAGEPGIGLATLVAVADAVGLDLVLQAYQGRQPSLRDSGQLAIAERIEAECDAAWQPVLEEGVGEHGEAIDLVLYGAREIIAMEIERMAADLQAQYRRADQERRRLAAVHGRPVRLVVVVENTRRNRATLAQHQALVSSVLPAGSREVLRANRTGRPLGQDGLLWIRR